MDHRITELAEGDCDELGRVHAAVWREAYAEVMPEEVLARMDPVRLAASWRRAVGSDAASTWVARDDDGLLGFVSAGPGRDEEPPTPTELWAINLLARAHGTGVADSMLAAALGDRAASLWVVTENARAIAFYARHGFVDDGSRAEFADTGVLEMRMVRAERGRAG